MPPDDLQAIINELAQLNQVSDMPRRVELCRSVLAQIDRVSAPQLWAAIHGELGNSLAQDPSGERAENIEKAIEYYQQALTIAREISDRQMEGSVLGNLGLAYASLGEFRQAIEYYEQALTIAREIGDWQGQGNRLDNLAIAYIETGQNEEALECLMMADRILTVIESPSAETIRRAIESLREKLGEAKFGKLEARVKEKLGGHT